ncbi:hypothetical protein [Taklimakanibacter deserti]|uniref:hypothetical protein n=1 Tax=Taklimakanibacter deserti TaxID=2267839 RepID=UPI0013C483D8
MVIDIQAMLAIFCAASAFLGAKMASFAGSIGAVSITRGLPVSRGPLRCVLVIAIQAMLAFFSAASGSFGATIAFSARFGDLRLRALPNLVGLIFVPDLKYFCRASHR